ncbi:long-chain fatty acid--CoA ligase [Haliea sp. E1-2-M8]|uniref:class I adenylate-forming enzyme family protein n=1 Tax=Haliea sp. E1-2-M8 TaxID=3064706 RepID=UPI0027212235|nr:long-chain fatty acid--CoA ligase [Haliea sp. E1-2-M8]MDO8863747.1 long-chain fatty acid--CoA ligase [Haliea sp. E1-2-M8]
MRAQFLHDLPAFQALRQPDAVAIWWRGEPTTYSQLNQRVERLAARLAALGGVGDRVGVLAWNGPQFVELIYACAASGRILVPLNARLAPAEWLYQLKAAGVDPLFADGELLRALRAHPESPPKLTVIDLQADYDNWLQAGPMAPLPTLRTEDPAWILFTSGSTGRPKGAVLSHRSFLAGLESAALARPVAADDRYLYPFPLFHVAAHNVLLQHQHGAAVVLLRSFAAEETLRACRELRVTGMSLAPTMIATLLEHPSFSPADLASVRTIGYGASAMPETLLRRLLDETGVGLCQSYGMTELSGSAAFLTVEDHRLAAAGRPELLHSVGKPLATVELKVAHESGRVCGTGEAGEILVRAPQCMLGYWRQPEATAAALVDGWLHTGDIGCFDAEGYLYIVDRKKDMIISGGENVASREVEEALRRHPAVRDCAVVGLPDPRWGEQICAMLVLAAEVSDADLAAHCRSLLAGYKTPKTWRRVAALPLNAAGKVDKPALRQRR